ncbi:MAG: EscU/YscU/HrcU family type III secretion system export apparatus switch protein [Treponema sp.]|nr:EscU/YscU/HrcU family type III secretion system export apparatus switch protein [Treponema sp.]
MKKAVTLSYPEKAPAPIITSVTKGELAERVLKIAADHDIMIEENAELTEVLSMQDIGTCVPEETWLVLSQIFAFLTERK